MSFKIIAVSIGIIFILSALLFIMNKKLNRVKAEKDQAISFNNARQDSIVYLKNKVGQETAKVAVLDLTNRNLRAMQQDERLAWIKNFSGINKRMSNLEQASRTTASIVANFKISLKDTTGINSKGDTVKTRKFDNKDKWLHLKGTIFPDTLITTAELDVPIESVIYLGKRTKKFLFFRVGPRSVESQSSSENPYVKITKSEITRVVKK